MENSNRNYSIDLLRFLSMLSIVIIHVINQGGILNTVNSSFIQSIIISLMIYIVCSIIEFLRIKLFKIVNINNAIEYVGNSFDKYLEL